MLAVSFGKKNIAIRISIYLKNIDRFVNSYHAIASAIFITRGGRMIEPPDFGAILVCYKARYLNTRGI